MIFQVHPLIVLSSLSLRERLISFQPVHDGVQRGRLVGLWDLCHYTPPHTPSGCCVLCLLEGRSFSPTVQSHYGLSATPSFLLGCSQEGITRVHYRPASATFWLMRDRDMCTHACVLVHTQMLPAEWLSEPMSDYLPLLRWGCLRHSRTLSSMVRVGCHNSRFVVRWFPFRDMGNSLLLGRKAYASFHFQQMQKLFIFSSQPNYRWSLRQWLDITAEHGIFINN